MRRTFACSWGSRSDYFRISLKHCISSVPCSVAQISGSRVGQLGSRTVLGTQGNTVLRCFLLQPSTSTEPPPNLMFQPGLKFWGHLSLLCKVSLCWFPLTYKTLRSGFRTRFLPHSLWPSFVYNPVLATESWSCLPQGLCSRLLSLLMVHRPLGIFWSIFLAHLMAHLMAKFRSLAPECWLLLWAPPAGCSWYNRCPAHLGLWQCYLPACPVGYSWASGHWHSQVHVSS